MAKLKQSFFDKIDDSYIKIIFFITYVIGAVIIFLNPNFLGEFTSAFLLTILMVTYLISILVVKKKTNTFIRDEQMGDSFYYLGFLFTLTALVFSLFSLGTDGIDDLLKKFGVAITTTLIGLIGRIIMSQFRESLDEIKEKAESQISAAARKLNVQLESSINILREQSIIIAKNTDKTLQDSSLSLRRFMEENNKILQDSTNQSKNVIDEFNKNAQEISKNLSKINIPTNKFQKFEESVDGFVNTLNSLEQGMKNSLAESEIRKIAEQFKSLSSSISSQSKMLNEELVDSKEALESLSKNLVGVAKFISENLKKK
jgi:hypothetical protein